jgi:uncharacterized surface protein with fasciclin (FAS1) repeats
MKTTSRLACIVLGFSILAFNPAYAEDPVLVRGAAMYADRTMMENIAACGDCTTLAAAIQEADLTSTFQGKGPYTLFAPSNEAFGQLPIEAINDWLKPENKNRLVGLLTFHVIPRALTMLDISTEASLNGGKAVYKTLEGDTLTIEKDSKGDWWVTDNRNEMAQIIVPDARQSNGVIHVINKVLTPVR